MSLHVWGYPIYKSEEVNIQADIKGRHEIANVSSTLDNITRFIKWLVNTT